jgi:ribonuclease-3
VDTRSKLPNERIEHLTILEGLVSYTFKNITLLHTALTHRSFVNENQDLNYRDNERLEFLGDAVLELCISDVLMKQFPEYNEGGLSKVRASVVNEQPLAKLAEEFRIGNFILLGRGEESSGGRHKDSILSNAFEAVIAAIYLDGGFEEALSFIARAFQPLIKEWTEDPFHHDYKTSLQELSQSKYKIIPKYRLIHEYGPDHSKIFEIRLTIPDIITAQGTGRSKKEAEQNAAHNALKELEHSNNNKT